MNSVEKLYHAVIPPKLRLLIRLYRIQREIAREKISQSLGSQKAPGLISRALKYHFFPETRSQK